MVLGVDLFVGGLLVVVIVVGQLDWLFVFPYVPLQARSAYLGLILTVAGFVVLCAGFVLTVYYDRKRSWCTGEIERSSVLKRRRTSVKTVNQILEEYMGTRRKRSN